MDYIFPIISYLAGAIPFGLVVGKMAGCDVRKAGSKNIGATNVSRLLGKKLGLLTLLLDSLKGFIPMLIATTFLPESDHKELIVCLSGLMGVVGHMFPIYLAFKGGKGVATGLGVFLYLSPLTAAISLVVFAASVFFSGFVSVGSLLASGLVPLWLYLLGASNYTIITAALVALLIWVKHHANISRLIAGNEKSWKKK
ncbi:MAG: glycerol-3-phosphate 1-O-acyltransferase PlsY [Desulfotalea sp.]